MKFCHRNLIFWLAATLPLIVLVLFFCRIGVGLFEERRQRVIAERLSNLGAEIAWQDVPFWRGGTVSTVSFSERTSTKGSPVYNYTDVAEVNSLSNLRHLDLSSIELNDDAYRDFGQLTSLKYLTVPVESISRDRLSFLSDHPSLKVLTVTGSNPPSAIDFISAIATIPRIKVSFRKASR